MKIKKILILCLLAVFSSLNYYSNIKVYSEEEDVIAKTYLTKVVETTPSKFGVYIPLSKYNEGYSCFGAGYDDISSGIQNKFLRLSNYDSKNGIKESYVSLNINNLPSTNAVIVSFDYRFSEGKTSYHKDDIVLKCNFRHAKIGISYSELEPQLFKDYSWNHKELLLSIEDTTLLSNELSFIYYFKNSVKSSAGSNYLDIDNVEIKYNLENYFANSGFDSIEVNKDNNHLISEINLSKDGRDQILNLKLDKEEIENFDQNTIANNILFNNSKHFEHYSALNYNDLKYVTSAPIYEVYSKTEDSFFLRYQNLGNMPAVNTFNNYFYNNETNERENIKNTMMLKYSFSYRLYMNEYIQNIYFKDNKALFSLSTRNSSANKTGVIPLTSLVINERGDNSWHTYSGYLNIASYSSTAYISISYFNYSEVKDNTIFDIDNFYISSFDENKNRFYNNGTFEFDKENNYHPITEERGSNAFALTAYNKETHGCAPLVENDVLIIPSGGSISYETNYVDAGAFRISFETSKEPNDLTIMLGGYQGTIYNAKTSNIYFSSKYIENKYVMYMLTEKGFDNIDLINNGDAFKIANLSVDLVNTICIDPGNYSVFKNACETLFNQVDSSKLTRNSKLDFDLYINRFNLINSYASQERMDEFQLELSLFIASLSFKADLSALNEQISASLIIYQNINQTSENASEYIVFEAVLMKAVNITEEATQEEVDETCRLLKVATDNLKDVSNYEK